MHKFYLLMAGLVTLTASAVNMQTLGFAKAEGNSVVPFANTKVVATKNLDGSTVAENPMNNLVVENRAKASTLPTTNPSNYTWKDAGVCSLTDDCFNSIFNVEVSTMENIELQEAEELPGLYRLVDPYKNYPYGSYASNPQKYLYLHCENPDQVFFEEFNTGRTLNSTYGAMYIDMAINDWSETAGYGKLRDGNVTFEADDLICYVIYQNKYKAYYANSNGKFCIKLPGSADYDLTVTNQTCAKNNLLTFNVTAGADIATIYYYVTNGIFTGTDANLQFVVSKKYTLPGSGQFTLNLDGVEEAATLFVVGVNAANEIVANSVNYFYPIYDNDDEWESLGWGVYTDDIVAPFYGYNNIQYEVEVQENVDVPGYYRIKNPYSSETPFGDLDNAHTEDHNHYIYINASDPDKVEIEQSTLGIDLGDGDVYIMGMSYNYGNDATDDMYGKLENGVITFPTDQIVMGFGSGLGLFYANRNGLFSLELPVATTIVLWDNSIKQFEAPYVHYAVDGEGAEFEEALPMVLLDLPQFAAELDEYDPETVEIWGQLIPATATHVKFSDADLEGTHTTVYEVEENKLYNGQDVVAVKDVDFTPAATPVEYYNLQGIRVDKPVAGQLVIRRQGNETSKVRL